ncbi:MAG: 6-carboxytetrahydropterin synthase [Phycisphaerae bacterium]|nr:6-carboxytetrahydropterin synthase [Phycisphaerae bacterium]
MTTVVRRVGFSAGHRVWGHEHECSNVHGHNYEVYFHATAEHLDDVGRVIDFRILKQRLGGWIERHWDHGFICHEADAEVRDALATIAGQKLFLLPGNPTAENLASYLLREVGPRELAGTGVRLVRVVLWETPNCFAEVSL